ETPKKRSSAVSPLFDPSGKTPGSDTGPESQRTVVPSAAIALNDTCPPPSVQTMPASVGHPPTVTGSHVPVTPLEPSPLDHEWPMRPDPSIVPSSASTESMMLMGNPTTFPADGETPATRVGPSKSSRKNVVPSPLMSNGLSDFWRYGDGPKHVGAAG